MFKLTLTIFFALFLFQAEAQLPSISDWFLSSGDWDKDPQLYVREFGTGRDTVIILHGGWGAEHGELLTACAGLTKEFHFVTYDQRGSLRSPFPDGAISYDAHIEDVERLRKALRLNKIKLVGHSMGGLLAAAYASRYPQHIRSLVLLAPADLKNPLPAEELALKQEQSKKLDEFFNRPEVQRELERYKLQRPNEELSSIERTSKFRINVFGRRMLYDVSNWSKIMGGGALYKGNVYELTEKTYPKEGWDYVAVLEKQSFPVSIITGDHDFIDFGNSVAKKWVAGRKQFTFTPIKNAGHLLWVDQPDALTKELRTQLNRK
ncbi:MAG TPA: alpha/beta hydrolase [Cyclobacteriaceae bacterium]|nr:alpha/beta hydrolase [Cyclobacteriaceae bacterium]